MKKVFAKNGRTNVRSSNSTSSSIKTQITETSGGDYISTTEIVKGFKWYVIKVNGVVGFVREDVVNIKEEIMPSGKKLTYLIWHCTATPEGRVVTKEDIVRWHTAPVSKGGRGWSVVGYARLVDLEGELITMREYNEDDIVEAWEITNGASGMNAISRHVVYAGGLDVTAKKAKDTRTVAQKETMKKYTLEMVKNHPNILIAGHYHFAAKACPSFDVEKWCKEIGVPTKNIYKK